MAAWVNLRRDVFVDLVLCNSPVFWLIGCCQCFHLNVMRNYNICYVLLCLFNDFSAERSIFIISLGMASAVLPQKTDLRIDVVVMLICNVIWDFVTLTLHVFLEEIGCYYLSNGSIKQMVWPCVCLSHLLEGNCVCVQLLIKRAAGWKHRTNRGWLLKITGCTWRKR